ncbi:hypothetical protein PSTG_11870 [Puccinia striiformis f. sp. tritici PST-78]|uniref:Uncharacterized protein n=1 Tax=Puccinia striiformis f. sp. tritici PST-78 TaxID=1165861 RepID=A0A0L0V673_9BASI|nr:hypothetical protein PSTG_11870 [Puccinia striiformis f. sp. tritici PST-78]
MVAPSSKVAVLECGNSSTGRDFASRDNIQPRPRKMNFLASTILVLWTVGCVGALPEISFGCTNKSIPWPECYHVLNNKTNSGSYVERAQGGKCTATTDDSHIGAYCCSSWAEISEGMSSHCSSISTKGLYPANSVRKYLHDKCWEFKR